MVQVFISWSGPRSLAVAQLLSSWLPDVLQAIRPWGSEAGLEKGSVWFGELSKTLADFQCGILCVTRANLNSPWLNFEAGALYKGSDRNRVIPLLIDLPKEDVGQPLASFNMADTTRADVFLLLESLNKLAAADAQVSAGVLRRSFDLRWHEFEAGLRAIPIDESNDPKQSQRADSEMLKEILALIRRIDRDMNAAPPAAELEAQRGLANQLRAFGGKSKARQNADAGSVLASLLATAGLNPTATSVGSALTDAMVQRLGDADNKT